MKRATNLYLDDGARDMLTEAAGWHGVSVSQLVARMAAALHEAGPDHDLDGPPPVSTSRPLTWVSDCHAQASGPVEREAEMVAAAREAGAKRGDVDVVVTRLSGRVVVDLWTGRAARMRRTA